VVTNSLAILSDSLHDLGDSLSIGFSWLMERRPTDQAKAATLRLPAPFPLAALVNAVVLILGPRHSLPGHSRL
jgi:cobalt-zinc-cadmium efflux system protein